MGSLKFRRHENLISVMCSIGKCPLGFFNRVEAAEVSFPYHRIEPSALQTVNAFRQRGSRRNAVYGVLRTCRLAKIRPPVVLAVAVDVIDLIFRPRASHPQKSEAVRKVHGTQHFNLAPPLSVHRSGHGARLGAATPWNSPSKDAEFRAVVQKGVKGFLSQFLHVGKLPGLADRGNLFGR